MDIWLLSSKDDSLGFDSTNAVKVNRDCLLRLDLQRGERNTIGAKEKPQRRLKSLGLTTAAGAEPGRA